MEFKEAYLNIVNASIDRNTKELPTILSCLDFENKNCLEIGAGPIARLSVKISGFAKHITCLEKYPETISMIKKEIKKQGLGKKISTKLTKDENKLPFEDKSFDVVYGAWLPHKLLTNPDYIKELDRVTKKYILLIMPGINDDVVRMREMVFGGEIEKRERYKKEISENLRKLDYKIFYEKGSLILKFPNEKTIRETFYCLDFNNKLSHKQKMIVDSHLNRHVSHLRNDFYCIVAEKK